jgi:hypothetical protein
MDRKEFIPIFRSRAAKIRIVRNACKNNLSRLAEWATASHVEKHTPVPCAKPAVVPVK